jgi:phosphatidylinositol alpha-mannosyltransferase
MRVLLTTPYDLAVPGGVNRHACELLDALTQRGIEARLVGPASSPVLEDDARVVRLGRVIAHGFNGAQSRVTLDWRIRGEVRRLVREFRPDVVHLQEPFLPVLNTFVLRAAGSARRVGTFHTYSETSRGYLWSWPWCRWINAQLDARIAVSAAAGDFAQQYHPAEYVVIPNGVRVPAAIARRPSGPPHTPVRLLFVGRAGEPRKGFSVLLDALARLEHETPGAFALTVVGPDQVPASHLPITSRGQLDDAALSEAYRAADVVVVPSVGGESFGLVAIEALAHGVPVVASSIRGYAEWLGGAGVGELVAPRDPAALAAAVRRVVDDPARHAACARRAVPCAAQFAWDLVVERVLRCYKAEAPP